MQKYFINENIELNKSFKIESSDQHHIEKVMRNKNGDQIICVDLKHIQYLCLIENVQEGTILPIEKLDIKYAYVFNKFYSELSKIEMKKQNSIDKRGKKISIIFSNRKEYSPDSIAHLIEWTNNYQVSIQPKIDELKSEVAGLYSIDHTLVSASFCAPWKSRCVRSSPMPAMNRASW